MVFDYIRRVDYLTGEPTLRIERKQRYQTVIGGLLNIIIIILTIIGIIYFGGEFYNREEPFVVSTERTINYVKPVEFGNPKTFIIFVGMETKDHLYYTDETIFTVKGEQMIIEMDDEGNQIFKFIPIEMVKCSSLPSNLTNVHSNFHQDYDLDLFYCVKPNNHYIWGYWGQKNYSSARIILDKCTNSTENNYHCKTEEDINEIIEGGIISFFYTNNMIDMKNYDNPLASRLIDAWNRVSAFLVQSIEIQMSDLEFVTDSGFLLENLNLIKTFNIHGERYMYSVSKKEDRRFLDLFFQYDNFGKKYIRSYIKIQDVITRIGGLIKALLIVGQFIACYSSDIEFYNDYYNNLEEKIALRKIFVCNKQELNISEPGISVIKEKQFSSNNLNNNIEGGNYKLCEASDSNNKLNCNKLLEENYFRDLNDKDIESDIKGRKTPVNRGKNDIVPEDNVYNNNLESFGNKKNSDKQNEKGEEKNNENNKFDKRLIKLNSQEKKNNNIGNIEISKGFGNSLNSNLKIIKFESKNNKLSLNNNNNELDEKDNKKVLKFQVSKEQEEQKEKEKAYNIESGENLRKKAISKTLIQV